MEAYGLPGPESMAHISSNTDASRRYGRGSKPCYALAWPPPAASAPFVGLVDFHVTRFCLPGLQKIPSDYLANRKYLSVLF